MPSSQPALKVNPPVFFISGALLILFLALSVCLLFIPWATYILLGPPLRCSES